MTSKRFSRIPVPILICVLFLTAFADPAQQRGASQASAKPNAASAPAPTSVPAQAAVPAPHAVVGSPDRAALSGVSTRRHDASIITPANSTLSFLPAVTYSSGGFNPNSVTVGDTNGDGKPDLVVANAFSNTVGILQGNGDGTFQTALTYDTGGQIPVSVAVANLVLGGGLQVVVANSCADSSACSAGGSGESGVAVLFAFGNPTPVTYRSGGTFIQSVKVADVNNDGIPDLLVANSCSKVISANCTTNTMGSVGVLLGHDGIFTLQPTYSSGGFQTLSLAVADVNGDGQPDLLVTNTCTSSTNCLNGSVGVLLGEGDGTFNNVVTYAAGDFPQSVAVADLNGDGKPDLVVADSSVVGVLLNNGDGTFGNIVTYSSGGSGPADVAIADLDGDGKLDVVVSNFNSGTIGVLLGNGDGTLQSPLVFATGGNSPFSVAIADLNGDGKLDLVVGNFDSNTIGVLLNDTGAPSSTATTLTSSLNPSTHGQPITFTATVTTSGLIAPTGTVNFKWGPDGIGQGTLNTSGVATFTTSILKPGPYKITAVYKGDASNLASTSAVLHQGVKP